MSTQLQAYANTFRQSHDAFTDLTRSLSDAQFNWKPDTESWSVAECVAHLNVVAESYLPQLEAAVKTGGPRADGPFTYGFLSRKLISAIGPGGPTLSASSAIDPSNGGSRSNFDKTQTMAVFARDVERYVAVCDAAEGLDLARIKVRYPFFRLLRLPLGAFLDITGLHALRHVRQAETVRTRDGFPSERAGTSVV